MKHTDETIHFSGVGLAIVVVAISIIVAALVETRAPGNIHKAADLAAAADRAATATAGPAAGLAPLIAPGAVPGARDISVRCHSVKGPMEESPLGMIGSMDMLISVKNPSTNLAVGGQMSRTEHYKLLGWAIDPRGNRLASGVCLVVDGKVDAYSKVLYGLSRPDVAEHFHNEHISASGFEIDISSHLLTPGRHRLQVVSIMTNVAMYLLPHVQNITIY